MMDTLTHNGARVIATKPATTAAERLIALNAAQMRLDRRDEMIDRAKRMAVFIIVPVVFVVACAAFQAAWGGAVEARWQADHITTGSKQ